MPFYLYAYCLMPNHVHLLVERRQDAISRVMHRLLTGYSRYYNRKYGRVGHLFQKRYKAILCQSDQYLAQLVRYIHLNPVRAKLVRNPAAYQYSSHRAYLGFDEPGMVDVEPVLRHFGATKTLAQGRFKMFVRAGLKLGRQQEYYPEEEQRILGTTEFVEGIKKRVGEVRSLAEAGITKETPPDLEMLLEASSKAAGLTREEICGQGKFKIVVMAKEAMILVGQELGASKAALAKKMGIHASGPAEGPTRERED